MKLIKLTNSKSYVKVDDHLFEQLNGYKWYLHKRRKHYYASRSSFVNGKKKTISMHRFILNVVDSKIQIDHVDGDTLNNQLSNLRQATQVENSRNSKKRNNCSSTYKGVCWDKQSNKWRSYICFNGKNMFVKLFNNELDAALYYNKKAIEIFGEFAKINKI